MRKATAVVLGVLGLTLSIASAQGAISANATVAYQQLSPTSYQYTVSLTNTGDTNISTLWFGWIPAYDLLASAPTSFTSPTGWNGINAPDTFGTASAQWTTTTNPLAAGQTLSGFTFTSPDTPATMQGTGPLGLQRTYSYVYIGAPEADPGAFFVAPVVPAPEPGSLAILFGLPALLIRRKR